jgi:ankyrin repeat protein
VEHGADVSIADSDGITALQHASRRGFPEIGDVRGRATTS